MVRKNQNIHTCDICGVQYSYCKHCSIVEPNYNASRFCSHDHQDIFAIIAKHSCGLATAEETLEALKGYDIIGLTEDIKKYIDSLQPKKVEVEDKAEVEAETDAETSVEVVKEVETVSKKRNFRTHE